MHLLIEVLIAAAGWLIGSLVLVVGWMTAKTLCQRHRARRHLTELRLHRPKLSPVPTEQAILIVAAKYEHARVCAEMYDLTGPGFGGKWVYVMSPSTLNGVRDRTIWLYETWTDRVDYPEMLAALTAARLTRNCRAYEKIEVRP